ncbi:MAG: hypothetical protein IJP48_11925 [Synergistaceae bacterium]|nr:hypothetical protein [Synergistaceae bacterium]
MTAIEAINEFVDTMLGCRDMFDKIEGSDEKLAQCIKVFLDSIAEITKTSRSDDKTGLKEIQESQTQTLRKMLEDVAAKMDATRKSMSFISSNKESFNIAVFGKVKAGKSYTGNFIMGNVIRDMGIQTSYDKIERPKVTVIDKGKITSSEKLAEIESNKDGFIVDPNEATSTIQLFNLGGMKWIDTPGIGSVTWENEILAQDFVDSADLIVYMSNSDAAGTQQDFKELKTLHDKKRRFLLLLTQSDTIEEEDCDDEGNTIAKLAPKSDEDRRSMEDYICESLHELGITELKRGYEILTISTKLALEALKNNDQAMWDASNLDKFLAILIDITKNESRDLKIITPGKRINSAIDEIIKILNGAKDTLNKHSQGLREVEEKLTDNNETLLAEMKNECYGKIDSFITKKAQEVENGGASVSASDINRLISAEVYNSVMSACKDAFAGSEKILSSYSESLKIQSGGDLSMKTDTISHTRREAYSYERDPDGFIENVRAFFGKKYYGSSVRDVTVTTEIKLGVNIAQVMSSITSSLDELFITQIPEILKRLADEIISPVRRVQEGAKSQIDSTITKLEGLKIAVPNTKG